MVVELFSRRTRHLDENGIALFADALLRDKTSRLPAGIRRHVGDCPTCKAAVTEIYDILLEQNADVSELHPFLDGVRRDLPLSRLALITRVAAVLVVVVGAALILTVYRGVWWGHPPAEVTAVTTADSHSDTMITPQSVTPEDTQHHALASVDVFAPSPEWEEMSRTTLRSEDFEILTPLRGDTVSEVPVFSWKGGPRGRLMLTVLNNAGEPVWQFGAHINPVPCGRTLTPGRYYWMVQTEDELLAVGSFFVLAGPEGSR